MNKQTGEQQNYFGPLTPEVFAEADDFRPRPHQATWRRDALGITLKCILKKNSVKDKPFY